MCHYITCTRLMRNYGFPRCVYNVTMAAHNQPSAFKARMISETEAHINKLVKRRDELVAEGVQLDAEIMDARSVLQSLKQAPKPAVPETVYEEATRLNEEAKARIEVKADDSNAAKHKQESNEKFDAEAEEAAAKPARKGNSYKGVPKKEQLAMVQRTWRDAVIELGKRPEGFTAQEIADHLGKSRSAFTMALNAHTFLKRMVTSTIEKRQVSGRNMEVRIYRYAEPSGGSPKPSAKPAESDSGYTSRGAAPNTGNSFKITSDDELRKILRHAEKKGARVSELDKHIRVTNPLTGQFTTLSSTTKNKALIYASLKKIGYTF
jgi:hypothetical protein